ncbi:MAG: thrombospondin type 3 repeat-containing protein [Desulfobacteraceae bacterium]
MWDYGLAWTAWADADQDFIPDDVDNCRLTANRKQTDSDEDGYGNICDADFDNNGVVGGNDYTLFKARWNTSAPYY